MNVTFKTCLGAMQKFTITPASQMLLHILLRSILVSFINKKKGEWLHKERAKEAKETRREKRAVSIKMYCILFVPSAK